MKNKINLIMKISIVFAIVLSFQACSLKFPAELREVEQSKNSYDIKNSKIKTEIKFINKIPKNNKVIIGQLKDMWYLQQNKKDIKSYSFIKEALINEFKARELPFNESLHTENSINLEKFKIHTSNIFYSPFVYLSMLEVTVNINGKEKKINAVVKRAKFSGWSQQAIWDSVYNEPIMILIKEITAKINKEYFGYRLSDKKVNELINNIEKAIETEDEKVYLQIYELGFSNNKKALDKLISYSQMGNEYIKMTAISVLGLLGGESQFEYLVTKYRTSKLWQDRAFALKAISDIGTQKTESFVKNESKQFKNVDTREAKWYRMMFNRYM